MQVEVMLSPGLKGFIPSIECGKKIKVGITDGTTVRMLLAEMKIPEGTTFFLLNDVYKEPDIILSHNDRITILPMLAGG